MEPNRGLEPRIADYKSAGMPVYLDRQVRAMLYLVLGDSLEAQRRAPRVSVFLL